MNQSAAFERRQHPRPSAPPPGLRVGIRLFTDQLAKKLFCCWQSTCIFILVQLMALALVAWSMLYRLPDDENAQALTTAVAVLQEELDELKSGWSEQQLAQIEQSLQREEARVFNDFPSLAAWLRRKSDQAGRLGLRLRYAIRQQQDTRLEDTIILPVQMSLKVVNDASDKAYSKVLAFVHGLVSENLHLEMQDTSVKSNGRGVTGVSLLLNVWVHDYQGLATVADSQDTGAETSDEIGFD